ncbi:MAG: class II glutamine amidotransferase [Candidatus Sumerlaeaceae bacterium]|nr:class II glutamine amidotransferase [Candidatus Sumerlaeaceae bacterium]
MIGVLAREPVEAAQFVDALMVQARDGKRPPGPRSRPHEDGYGVAVYSGGHWIHIREQCPMWVGALDASRRLCGTVMLLHARLASPDLRIDLTKTHPFAAATNGSTLMFCHNGTIRAAERLPVACPDHATDTERYFALVLERVKAKQGLSDALLATAEMIYSTVGEDAVSVNALLTDGRELVAYRGRITPQNMNYHTLFVAESPALRVVSTEPFDLPGAGDWRGMAPQEIVVWRADA